MDSTVFFQPVATSPAEMVQSPKVQHEFQNRRGGSSNLIKPYYQN